MGNRPIDNRNSSVNVAAKFLNRLKMTRRQRLPFSGEVSRLLGRFWLVSLLALCATWVPSNLHAAPPAGVDFARDVLPILSNYCFQCHGPDANQRQGDLRLDQQEAAHAELASGSRPIVPKHPEKSEIIARLTTDDSALKMPPASFSRHLTAAQIEIVRRWIADGGTYAPHWAYVAPTQPARSVVSDPQWSTNPVDDFILTRLDREGLRPTVPIDQSGWLRRVSLDFTGLPPTVADVEAFETDSSPDACERVVDRLLASPGYGERWASMWLDLARYGDSAGYIHDPPRTIWRFRDWLIEALNRNLSYDQMTIEMLAGDLLPDPTIEQIIATGFHRNTTTNTEGGSVGAEFHFASVCDRVNTTMQVWMGSSFACAQCHNHKYDPFTQQDYYQIFAVFNNTADFNSETPAIDVPRVGRHAEFSALKTQLNDVKSQLDELTKRIDADQSMWESSVAADSLPEDLRKILAQTSDQRMPADKEKLAAHHHRSSSEWVGVESAYQTIRREYEQISTTTMVMQENTPRPTHIAIRGEWKSPGVAVQPGVPAVLHSVDIAGKFDRLGLARWLVDPRNPLTARVSVNRYWQEIFGIGIVESSEEFGLQGETPSHPELLDWLATELIRRHWDTHQLLKLIVLSSTYRQSSRVTPEILQRDPHNRLLGRGPRTRLSAETLRDQALAVSGLISEKMFGPPVHPYMPRNGLAAAFGASTDWETSTGDDRHRRAVYTRWRRNLPYPSMVTFDMPDRQVCSSRRLRTNTPIQALVTLNDPVFVEAAQALARQILLKGGTTEELATFAFRTVLSRTPSALERQQIVDLYQQASRQLGERPTQAEILATRPFGALPPGMSPIDAAAWTVVGNMLLNLDEVLAKR